MTLCLFVSIPQDAVARTSDIGAEYHEKTKHVTHDSVSVEGQSSAYAEIEPEVH